MKIVIGLPTPDRVSPNFSLHNLPQIIATAKSQMPELELYTLYKTGVMTSSNRNFIVKEAQGINADAILWLDVDMIYPGDIVKMLWDANKDIIGSVYFKRSEPYDPVVYVRGDNPVSPYRIVDPLTLTEVTEVDGVGFGGMMVKMSVYNKMTKYDLWHHYGSKFGFPTDDLDRLSHDLQFCKEAQEMGFKVWVHPKVMCGHFEERLVTAENWQPNGAVLKNIPKIAVLLPAINLEKANRTIEQLQKRANFDADYYAIEDVERTGFIKTINGAVKNIEADYYVYVAEDAYAGQNWLYFGIYEMIKKKAGLLAFNDGKWNGSLASFGMVEAKWMRDNYEGHLFYPSYKSHYADTELTLIAMSQKKLAYTPDSLLIEVDYDKHGVNIEDKELFNIRKKSFGSLSELFS